MSAVSPAIEPSWKAQLEGEFASDYFKVLKEFLIAEKGRYAVFPQSNRIFNAFNSTPFNEVKVVILGQDPYHGKGQAHGLCFSVPDGVSFPPSLQNIFKEIHDDLGVISPKSGNLEPWAKQGVFLLNATLTVRENQAGSHQNKGWENFTDAAIKALSDKKEGIVFLLWGKYAQDKAQIIDTTRHYVLSAPHPSPFSANRGFFGCKHFSKTNELLIVQGKEAIRWELGGTMSNKT